MQDEQRKERKRERERVLNNSSHRKVAGRFGRKIKSVLSRRRERERKERAGGRVGGIAGIMESSTCGPISRVREMWCGMVRYEVRYGVWCGTLMVGGR